MGYNVSDILEVGAYELVLPGGTGSISVKVSMEGQGYTTYNIPSNEISIEVPYGHGVGVIETSVGMGGQGLTPVYEEDIKAGNGKIDVYLFIQGQGNEPKTYASSGSISVNMSLNGFGISPSTIVSNELEYIVPENAGVGEMSFIGSLYGVGYLPTRDFGSGEITYIIKAVGAGRAEETTLSNIVSVYTSTLGFGAGSIEVSTSLTGYGLSPTIVSSNSGIGTIASFVSLSGVGFRSTLGSGTINIFVPLAGQGETPTVVEESPVVQRGMALFIKHNGVKKPVIMMN